MKKGICILTSIVALMLLSFAPPQENKVVRLENGNYSVQNLKMNTKDVDAIQKQIEELSELIDKEYNNDIGKEDGKKLKFQDFKTIYEGKEGFKLYIGAAWNDEFTFLSQELYEDVISKIAYHEKEEKKAIARFKQEIDAIMNPYLQTKN